MSAYETSAYETGAYETGAYETSAYETSATERAPSAQAAAPAIAPLSPAERRYLLALARAAITAAVAEGRVLPLDPAGVPPGRLREPGACFVTLTERAELRGCTGNVDPREPLAECVLRSAVATALYDFRFEPLRADELPAVRIEISVLAPPQPFAYAGPNELVEHLVRRRPGVIVELGPLRATFLPQVWEKLPSPDDFLGHLCAKAGLPAAAWRLGRIGVQLYDVEHFEEEAQADEPVA